MLPEPTANQHDAETRQFLALVDAGRPGLAFALGAMRSPVALRVAGIVGLILAMAVAYSIGAPRELVETVISKIG